jgi:Zn-dependent protease with chaperone function
MNYQAHPKENLYFAIKLIVTIVFYLSIIAMVVSIEAEKFVAFIPIIIYLGIFALYFLFRHGILIGYLKGNAIRVSENQFPEVYKLAESQSKKLGLSKIPSIYVLQAGGLLNAFATRFFGSDFVVIYSDILETAYEQGNKALEFIVAHELGHIQRKHSTKHLLLFPSLIIPFLNPAYSRACEYTCDRIGYFLCPEGATPGMLVLAAGKRLYSKIHVDEFLLTSQIEYGFWKWFAEIISTHPNLPKRIIEFKSISEKNHVLL